MRAGTGSTARRVMPADSANVRLRFSRRFTETYGALWRARRVGVRVSRANVRLIRRMFASAIHGERGSAARRPIGEARRRIVSATVVSVRAAQCPSDSANLRLSVHGALWRAASAPHYAVGAVRPRATCAGRTTGGAQRCSALRAGMGAAAATDSSFAEYFSRHARSTSARRDRRKRRYAGASVNSISPLRFQPPRNR